MSDRLARGESVAESESLLRLVERLSDRMSRGESIDLEAELASRPHDAERLREVFAGLEFMQFMQEPTAAHPGTRNQLWEAEPAAGVLGDFRILREIGRGGMGVVYEAEQISLQRRVALKMFPYAGICAPRQLARFQHEARAAASLHHPHIVPVFAVGCERGMHFYAMQFIEGRSLAHLLVELKQSGALARSDSLDPSASTSPEIAAVPTVREPVALSARQVAEWGAQAADALDYAHSLGIVHRDIKPANLLLDDRQRLWVTDFGLAQIAAVDGLTMTGDILGTLRYMSPEQAVGERGVVDQRTDVYSLGATLYELLSGQPVFGPSERADLLRRILHDEPPPLRRLNPQVPIELATIVHKCLERDPASRYATANRVADDLRRFLSDQPIKARPPTWGDRARKWSRRNRGLVQAMTLFGILCLTLSSAAAILIDRERQRTRFEQQARQIVAQRAAKTQRTLAVNHYVTQINRANRAYEARNFSEAGELLAACPLEFRGVEWRALARAIESAPPAPAARHQGMAYCIRVSPDRKSIVTTGQDGIRIWQFPGFQPLQHLVAHRGDVNGAAFSADGKRLATAGDDFTVRVWDTGTWQELVALPQDSHVVAAEFLPGRNLLVTAQRHRGNTTEGIQGRNAVQLWDAASWKNLGILYEHADLIQSLAVSPAGDFIATGGSDSDVCIWNVAEQRLQIRIPQVMTAGVNHVGVNGVAFAHRTPILAAAGGDGVVRLWDVAKGSLQGILLGEQEPLQFVAFSPEDRLLAAGGRANRIDVWRSHASTGVRQESEWRLQWTPQLWAGEFLDDRWLITAGKDGAITCRDSQLSQNCRRIPMPLVRTAGLAFTPDSLSIVVAADGLKLLDCDTGEMTRTLVEGESFQAVCTTAEEDRLIAVNDAGVLSEWRMSDWTRLRVVETGCPQVGQVIYFSRFRAWLLQDLSQRTIAVYRDGRISESNAAVAAGDLASSSLHSEVAAILQPAGRLTVWSGETAAAQRQVSQNVRRIDISQDGRQLALGASDGTYTILNIQTLEHVSEFASHEPQAAVFAPDGSTLAIGRSASIMLWNTETGRLLIELTTGFLHVEQLQFSPDGGALAAVGRIHGHVPEIVIWDVSTPEQSENRKKR